MVRLSGLYIGAVRTRTGVLLCIAAFVAGAGAMALVAAIAGLWNGTSNPVILNTNRVVGAIEASILHQRHLHSRVVCPVNIEQRQGVKFYCQATVGRNHYPVQVTQVDGNGHVVFTVL
jgi:hypothetical protein